MRGIEVARLAQNDGVQLFRARKDNPLDYDAKPYFCGRKGGWVILDSFSASAIVQVYDALNETNRTKYETLSLQKMAKVAFKFVK